MRVTFVRPNMSDARASDALQPLAFAVLAGLTPPDIELTLLDDRLEAVDCSIPSDLVAFSVETYTARRAYLLAEQFRARGVPVVMGGYHPTFLPDEALAHADAVVIGDAEGLWPQVLADARAGKLQRVYRQQAQPPLAEVRYDRTIFRGKRYARLTPVQYGRGCRFACDFCSIHAFYGSHLRQRPLHELLAEIEALEQRFILLVDDNLFASVELAERLFRALKPLNLRWACQISIDIAQNERLLDLMAESGCTSVLIGFESLNEGNLRQMKKLWNLRGGDYASAVSAIQARGIMIYGTFVFGYDHDTPDSFERAVEFALAQKLFLANFNPLTPTPGAALYDRLEREGRLLFDRWWLDPSFRYGQATFRPRAMSADDLTEGCFRARKLFNRYSAIAGRALDTRANARNLANLGVFLAGNLISRREIYRKQGRSLG